MVWERHRRKHRTAYMEPGMTTLELALKSRAKDLDLSAARGVLPDGTQLSDEGRLIIGMMAQEDRILAEELHYW